MLEKSGVWIYPLDTPNMKSRNTKFLSMLNNMFFYLHDVYPRLYWIVFIDDDVVVQKDMSGLWEIEKGRLTWF